MAGLAKNRRKARRSRHQLPRKRLAPRSKFQNRPDHTKRLIRLYRNPKIQHYSQKQKLKSNAAQDVLPIITKFATLSSTPQKGYRSSESPETANIPLPVPGTGVASSVAPSKQQSDIAYAMINFPLDNATHNTPSSLSSRIATAKGNANYAKASISSSFTPLPPLLSAVATPSSESHATSTRSAPSSPENVLQKAPQKQGSKLATPFIVLLAIGAGCLILGIYLLLRVWTRPRHKRRIKPSLPILEKSLTDYDDYDGKDSPVFGGKERITARPDSDGPMWAWVQYSKPDLQKDPQLGSDHGSPKQESLLRTVNATPSSDFPSNQNRARESFRTDLFGHQSQQHLETPSWPIQRVENAVTRNPGSRFSCTSLYTVKEQNGVGLAIGGTPQLTPFTADGHQVMDKSRSKNLRRSKSYSIIGERRRRDSGYRPDSAYEGADVSSPPTYFQPISTPTVGVTPSVGTEGRARIQSSYYTGGTYPRLSTVPVTYSIATATKVNLSQAQAQAVGNNNYGRDLERASDFGLVYAGGAYSPTSSYANASPQPSLYPDDSLSVAGPKHAKRRSHVQFQNRISSEIVSTSNTTQSSQAKNLLEMEFGVSQMSLSDLAGTGLGGTEGGSRKTPGNSLPLRPAKGRSGDKPPRVPSPPPLPSLTQMALAHSNPEAYSNYRSPTYSIYGLYGNDRKSVGRSSGH